MADRGRPIPAALVAHLRRLVLEYNLGIKAASRAAGTSKNTTRKYTRPAKTS